MGVKSVAVVVKHPHVAFAGCLEDFAGLVDPFGHVDSKTALGDASGPVSRIALDFDNPLPPPSCPRFRRINVPCPLD